MWKWEFKSQLWHPPWPWGQIELELLELKARSWFWMRAVSAEINWLLLSLLVPVWEVFPGWGSRR